MFIPTLMAVILVFLAIFGFIALTGLGVLVYKANKSDDVFDTLAFTPRI